MTKPLNKTITILCNIHFPIMFDKMLLYKIYVKRGLILALIINFGKGVKKALIYAVFVAFQR